MSVYHFCFMNNKLNSLLKLSALFSKQQSCTNVFQIICLNVFLGISSELSGKCKIEKVKMYMCRKYIYIYKLIFIYQFFHFSTRMIHQILSIFYNITLIKKKKIIVSLLKRD